WAALTTYASPLLPTAMRVPRAPESTTDVPERRITAPSGPGAVASMYQVGSIVPNCQVPGHEGWDACLARSSTGRREAGTGGQALAEDREGRAGRRMRGRDRQGQRRPDLAGGGCRHRDRRHGTGGTGRKDANDHIGERRRRWGATEIATLYRKLYRVEAGEVARPRDHPIPRQLYARDGRARLARIAGRTSRGALLHADWAHLNQAGGRGWREGDHVVQAGGRRDRRNREPARVLLLEIQAQRSRVLRGLIHAR